MAKTIKKDSIFSSTKSVFNEERAKMKAKKEESKKIPLGIKIVKFLKTWGLRFFYTVFFGAFSYVWLLVLTAMIPAFANIVLQGIGFTYQTLNEIILAGCASLFFTAWIFVISFVVEKAIFKLYIKGMKGTIDKDFKAKMEANKAKLEEETNK